MIILGLGSNLGNRLQYLRNALRALKQHPDIQVYNVSPVYRSDAQLTEHAPTDWNKEFFNLAISCHTTLTPFAFLNQLKQIEQSIGRPKEYQRWQARVIDIDILAWDDLHLQTETLTIPHPSLTERPFALWPLADLWPLWISPSHQQSAEQLIEAWGSRYTGDAPFKTKQINQRVDTPRLVGTLNLTPNSNSEDGIVNNVDKAIQRIMDFVKAGAEVIDIGAESTAPGTERVSSEKEWQRLKPVLDALQQTSFDLPPLISIDTYQVETAERVLRYPIHWLNDVTGLCNPKMRALLRDAPVDCVVMHHLSIPPRRDLVIPRDQHPADFILNWAKQQIEFLGDQGFAKERIILDPGLGFGKTPGQSLALLQHMDSLIALQTRVLIGHSRKSYLAPFSPHPARDRDIETAAISTQLVHSGIDYLRIHNVDSCARTFRAQCAYLATQPRLYKTNQTPLSYPEVAPLFVPVDKQLG